MDEQISTTPESSSQATSETVAENQTTDTTSVQSESVEAENASSSASEQKSETNENEGIEKTQEAAEPVKNWEKIAKDNQAAFTKATQELADLKKQIEAQKPQIVDKNGKITQEYEQKYRLDIDNREFLAYDQLARQLAPEARNVVENLLNEAKALYNPSNKRAYNEKLSEIKNYFHSDIVEQIALEKRGLESDMQAEFDKMLGEEKLKRANNIAAQIEAIPDLKELVSSESENYSEPVFGIIKQMFDLTGGVDLEMTQNAIKSIKELGVKEYLANQKVNSVKEKASVPAGSTITEGANTEEPSRDYLVKNPSKYRECCEKWTQAKIDDIIMKG